MESIDVFDTALYRDVYEPRDIFRLIENNVGGNFYKRRIEAEQKAATVNAFYGIKDIYRYLMGFNPQLEFEYEINHVYANPKILEMYNKNPKNYVFISDMYLPASDIKKLLEKCGYKSPRVFVSCEEKAKKSSGVLFETVQRKVGKITRHYGDNYRADIEGAKKVGITPVYATALQNIPLQLPAVKSPMLKKYAAEIMTNNDTPVVKMAKFFAPLIYDFTRWVLDKRRPEQAVYFLSRDMFMPYVIAHEILKENNVYYMYASRKALTPLVLHGKDKVLIDKMHTIFGAETCRAKKAIGTKDCLDYLKSTGIKNGDIIVDIGYSGTTQRIVEQALNIKLVGKYIQLGQVPKEFSTMDTRQYLNRMALIYVFLAEFIFTSPEDNMDGYRNGKPIFTPDNEQRKKYAREIVDALVNTDMYNRMKKMELTLFDIEQMLIHIQQNPSIEMLHILNEPILTNRRQKESCINCIKEEILQGKLLECYNHSYAKPLFKKLMQSDTELKTLLRLLPS